MARYYFDSDDGQTTFRDEVGSDLADDQAARNEATLTLAEMAKHYIPGEAPQKNLTMWVRNEQGEALLQVALSFAIRPA